MSVPNQPLEQVIKSDIEHSINRLLISLFFKEIAFSFVKDLSLVPLCIEMLVFLMEDEFDKAIKVADQILEQREIYKIYSFKHSIYLQINKLEEAMEMIKKAHKLKEKSRKMNYFLGRMYRKLDNLDEALIYMKKSVEVKPNSQILYEIGLLHQKREEHELALKPLTDACDIRAKNKYYIAKMNSFKALKKYDEALECCQIAILAKPQKAQYYLYKQDLLILQGKIKEAEQLEEMLQNIDSFYTLQHFEEKRKLETERVLLQKRQSSIKFRQTKSTIITKKLQTALVEYTDALYYSFTYFYICSINQGKDDYEKKIGSQLSTKQYIYVEKFDELILNSLNALFPSVERMNRNQVLSNLAQWQRKLEPNQNANIYQSLFNLFSTFAQQEKIREIISDRLTEDFSKKFEREKKHYNQNLTLLLGCIAKELQNADSKIFDSVAAQLGLEHGLFLLGFFIIFPQLSDDEEDIQAIIWRLFVQKDLNQLYLSQSNIKVKSKEDQERQECINSINLRSTLLKNQSMINAMKYLSQIEQQK